MVFPLLYEINTLCWLRLLSKRHGHPISLANVPKSEIDRWQNLGFTHIWAMGIWTTGPESRFQALKHQAMHVTLAPQRLEDDIHGSPYAISDYTVPMAMGGERGLAIFRQKLNERGMKLLLDFVPNHFGLDHPWIVQKPEAFVHSHIAIPESVLRQTPRGPIWIAHGKDPNFAPWTDTVQIDYRRMETRVAKIALLKSVADRCDGVRCDMAMLLLNDVFATTWSHVPVIHAMPKTEFWQEAITTVKKVHPHFLFLAEAYWGLEDRLQALGFDHIYNKSLCDSVHAGNYKMFQEKFTESTPEKRAASCFFLENHDERRIASLLSPSEHLAAALLLLGLPGMRLLYEGQLEGWELQVPVQLGRWPDQAIRPEIVSMYERLLSSLKDSAVGRGTATVLHPTGWPGNASYQNLIIILWRESESRFDLVVVNLAPLRSQCRVHLSLKEIAKFNWEMRDVLGLELYHRDGPDLVEHGLFLDVPGHAAQLFRFTSLH